jgi:ATP-dependent Clp protease ATP-binding subunit ClpC
MFERFTDRARRVVVLAQEEARMLNHNYIGTEHLLLGLIHEGKGIAAKSLEMLGIDLESVRSEVEKIIGKQEESSPPGGIPFTPQAKKALELSLREALKLGHADIDTEHILLGLVREGEGVAAQVLQGLGADVKRVRRRTIQLLSGYVVGPASEREELLTEEEEEVMSRVADGYSTAEIARELRVSPRTVQSQMEGIFQRLGARDRTGAVAAWLAGRPRRNAPRCPRCGNELEESGVVARLDLPVQGSDEKRAVSVAFCRRCGTWLGTV